MKRKKMDPEAKKRWLRNLRSGKYKQGRGYLCKIDRNGDTRFCCLGVLADEEVYGDWHLYMDNYVLLLRSGKSGRVGCEAMLSPNVCKRLKITKRTMEDLALMNDSGRGFRTIANWIEENL